MTLSNFSEHLWDMRSLEPPTLVFIAECPKVTILGQFRTTKTAKMVGFKYWGQKHGPRIQA